jgi:hypothetical protein
MDYNSVEWLLNTEINMSDDFEKFYENKESNEDSKSDARVALVLVICFVAAALFWVSGQ